MRKKEIIVSAVCMFFAGAVLWLTYGFKGGHYGGPLAASTFYPRVISLGIIVLSGILIFSESIRKKSSEKIEVEGLNSSSIAHDEQSKESGERMKGLERINAVRMLIGALICVLYTVFLDIVGYALATPVMLAVFCWVLGLRNWFKIVSFSVGITLAMYVVFDKLLDVVLPAGVFPLP